MNLWIISAFDPTPIDKTRPMRFMGIADAAIKRKHQVTYFNNTFRHSTRSERFQGLTYHTVDTNYNLIFVPARPYKKNISVHRLMSHHQFGTNLLLVAKAQPKPDIILISLPPLSSADKLSSWAKKQGIPLVVDIIDPWPDALFTRLLGWKSLLYRVLAIPLGVKLKRILKKVSGITAISSAYIDWARTKSRHQKPLNFYYPAVKFKDIQEQLSEISKVEVRDNHVLNIVYAGSLESSYDIPTILEASQILETKHPGKTRFHIAGKGSQEDLIRSSLSKMPNLSFVGRLGRKDLIRLFYHADIGLIQHVKGATQTVTYKFFDYLGAGLPVINSLKSEIQDLILENKVGFNHEPGDALELAHCVEHFITDKQLLTSYKQNALKVTSQLGDSDVIYGKMIIFLEQIFQSK